jgi:hypothetical protein
MFGFIKWTIIFGLALAIWCSYSLYSSLTTEEQVSLRKDLALAIETGESTHFKEHLKGTLTQAASKKVKVFLGGLFN